MLQNDSDRPQSSFTSLIVTYNSAAEVPDLLTDLRRFAPDSPVIVIDNASVDSTATLIRSRFPEVRLIQNAENVGYARAVNQGVALCDSPYVLLLNPDIRILTPSLFQAAIECLESSPRVAIAAPLQFKDGKKERRLNFTWSYWSPRALRLYLRFLMQRREELPTSLPVTFLNAGCMFIRRRAYESVGGLSERYFLYGEEPDLCLKLKRYGWECRLLPQVSVVHYRERSLRTVSLLRRMRIRTRAIWNIGDALARGVGANPFRRVDRETTCAIQSFLTPISTERPPHSAYSHRPKIGQHTGELRAYGTRLSI